MRTSVRYAVAIGFVFAGFHALQSVLLFVYYVLIHALTADDGVTLARFFAEHGFVARQVANLVISAVIAVAFGVAAWISNAKSAKDRSRLERSIDAWVTKLSRNDR